MEKPAVHLTPLQHQELQDLNSINTHKRDRIIYNISVGGQEKQFAKVELPMHRDTVEMKKKQKQKRNQSAADILNRVQTTKYQNRLKQLKILAATPTYGVKTLKAVGAKSPVKRRPKFKTKLMDSSELTSQDMYKLKRQEVLSRLKHTQLTEADLEKLAIQFQDSNGFRILCSVVLLQIYIKETDLKIEQADYFVQVLVDAMERVVSTSEFYHDRALDCLFHLVRPGGDSDYYRRIKKILNVKDLGLCENYWKVIADHTGTYLFKKLGLENLLVDHFQLYSDSHTIRASHAKIIHALRPTNIGLFQNLLDILVLSDDQTETQSLCIYAVREYFHHSDFSQLARLIACREGMAQKMVAILQAVNADFTKILLPLSQVMIAILEKSQKISLFGFKRNNSEKRDPRKPISAMHNFSSVKGPANLPVEAMFKLALIQAGIMNTIDVLCGCDQPLQLCQLGLNFLSFFTEDYEALQVKIPVSLLARAEMPLTSDLGATIAVQIVNHLKLRAYDAEHMQIVRKMLQEIPNAKAPVSELVTGLLDYLMGLPLELWRGLSPLISALQTLDKQTYWRVLRLICECKIQEEDLFIVQEDYNILI